VWVVKNHGEKTKDMAESVLPSAARKSARAERRRIHKAQRARQRVALAMLDVGGVDEFAPDFREGRRLSATRWMVLDRRSADKIGPLTRWAVAVVIADPDLRDAGLAGQVEHFARLFPDNLIGRHAVQHIEWALRQEAARHTWLDRRSIWAKEQYEHQGRVASEVRRIIESGSHGALNAVLRQFYQQPALENGKLVSVPPARYLLEVKAITSQVKEAARSTSWVLMTRPSSNTGADAYALRPTQHVLERRAVED
jgi:hypothetical protein